MKKLLVACFALHSVLAQAESQAGQHSWILPAIGATVAVGLVATTGAFIYTNSLFDKSKLDIEFKELNSKFSNINMLKKDCNLTKIGQLKSRISKDTDGGFSFYFVSTENQYYYQDQRFQTLDVATKANLMANKQSNHTDQNVDILQDCQSEYVNVLNQAFTSLKSLRAQTKYDIRFFNFPAQQHKTYQYENMLRNHTSFKTGYQLNDVKKNNKNLDAWKISRKNQNIILSILSCVPFHRYIDPSVRCLMNYV